MVPPGIRPAQEWASGRDFPGFFFPKSRGMLCGLLLLLRCVLRACMSKLQRCSGQIWRYIVYSIWVWERAQHATKCGGLCLSPKSICDELPNPPVEGSGSVSYLLFCLLYDPRSSLFSSSPLTFFLSLTHFSLFSSDILSLAHTSCWNDPVYCTFRDDDPSQMPVTDRKKTRWWRVTAKLAI